MNKTQSVLIILVVGIIALHFTLRKYFPDALSFLPRSPKQSQLKRRVVHDQGVKLAEDACPWDLKLGSGIGKVKLGGSLEEFQRDFPETPIIDERVARLGFFAVAFQDRKVRAISITPLSDAPDCFTIQGTRIEKGISAEDFVKLDKDCKLERTQKGKELFDTTRCPGYFKAVSSSNYPGFTRVSLDLNDVNLTASPPPTTASPAKGGKSNPRIPSKPASQSSAEKIRRTR